MNDFIVVFVSIWEMKTWVMIDGEGRRDFPNIQAARSYAESLGKKIKVRSISSKSKAATGQAV